MKTSSADPRGVLALLVALGSAAPAAVAGDTFSVGGYHYAEAPTAEWNLPGSLRELSGFVTDDQGRLFALNDEIAIVHQIDYAEGGIVKSFALGNPPVRGDFEGIALVDGRFYVTNSDGVLFVAPEGAAGDHVQFERIETGIGRTCEVEGIEYAADEQLLYFACKTPRIPALVGKITVVAWSTARRAAVPERTLSVDLARFGNLPGKGPLQPSDIAMAPDGRNIVLTAAKRRALITLSRDGAEASAVRLPKSKPMKQIEALAFGTGGTLLVGSEGKDKGRMRVYRAAD